MAVDGTTRGRALPAEVIAALRLAFAEEVTEQVPVLQTAIGAGDAGRRAVRRAAHVLGSSAHVVGEGALTDLARDVEARLDTGRSWQPQARALLGALTAWSAAA